MKAVIIPIILLLIVAVSVIAVSTYSEKTLDKLIEQTKKLPDIPDQKTMDSILNIEKEWNSRKEIYSTIIKFDFVYNFSKEISNAKAGCIADDPGTYLAAKKSIINLLEYIRDVQKLRLDNLL